MEAVSQTVEQGLCQYEHGIDRGDVMATFVEENVRQLTRLDGLDLGCGSGGISIAFKKRCKFLCSGDIILERISLTKKRVSQNNIKGIFPVCLNSINLCFPDNTFDFVIMNGLLEWVGTAPTMDTPTEIQRQVMAEVKRILKDDGFVYLAIENRYYPSHFLRDPHVHTPLVTVLPRQLAHLVSKFLKGEPYRVYIHSYWKLNQLLETSGFRRNEFFFPLFHYHFPSKIIDINSKKKIINGLLDLPKEDMTQKFMYFPKNANSFMRTIKVNVMKLFVRLNLAKLFAQSFIVICHKN